MQIKLCVSCFCSLFICFFFVGSCLRVFIASWQRGRFTIQAVWSGSATFPVKVFWYPTLALCKSAALILIQLSTFWDRKIKVGGGIIKLVKCNWGKHWLCSALRVFKSTFSAIGWTGAHPQPSLNKNDLGGRQEVFLFTSWKMCRYTSNPRGPLVPHDTFEDTHYHAVFSKSVWPTFFHQGTVRFYFSVMKFTTLFFFPWIQCAPWLFHEIQISKQKYRFL